MHRLNLFGLVFHCTRIAHLHLSWFRLTAVTLTKPNVWPYFTTFPRTYDALSCQRKDPQLIGLVLFKSFSIPLTEKGFNLT